MIPGATSRTVQVNGIEMAVQEQGAGPLVVLCHGWPELSHSWRHQLPALAQAGFRTAAPDMRGFGRTSAPAEIGAYTLFHNVGDMVALVAALGERQAIIVGHDWGAPVAWHAALFRPDVFRAVAGLSVPPARRARGRPLELLREAGIETFYWQYFQEPGRAETEFERDVDRTIRAILYGRGLSLMMKPGQGFLGDGTLPASPPAWLSEEDIAHVVETYRRTGFRGGLNWYRNIDRNWELTAPWQDFQIRQPALFIAGSRDPVIRSVIGEKNLQNIDTILPNLKAKVIIEGAGHWIQQERPAEVNDVLIPFLRQAS
jgi:pimeloyl-ACP methyl ester carboxylesterase